MNFIETLYFAFLLPIILVVYLEVNFYSARKERAELERKLNDIQAQLDRMEN